MKIVLSFVLFICVTVVANGQIIKGRIMDSGGQAVTGAGISIKNAFTSTVSDDNGNFILTNTGNTPPVLVISAVGFETREVSLKGAENSDQDIILTERISSLKEVMVTANRKPEVIDRTPASVQVINTMELRLQAAISPNLSNMLGLTVPSLGLGSNTTSNTGQTLRGRTPLIMIDGIPQSTPLRNGSRDMRTLDPSVIERVEVIKGATAMYGNGADGGVINYITLKPHTNKAFNATTSLVKTGMLVHGDETGGIRLGQQFTGKKGKFDYAVAGLYEKTGVYKDAAGVPITPVYGYGESDITNIFAKTGINLNSRNRVELMYNYFGSRQNSDYIEQVGRHGVTPTIGVKGDNPGENEGTRYNHNIYAKYLARKLFLNTSLEASAYFQKFFTVYGYSAYFTPAGQSTIYSDKKGLRLTLNTPFNWGSRLSNELVYGIDYLNDQTGQSLTDGRVWVPRMRLNNPAPFIQLNTVFNNHWIIKAGFRHDQANLNIPTFSQIKTTQANGGKQINGGDLSFNASTFNAGLRYAKWEIFKPFISFSQGFSMVDIGHYVRSAKEDDIAKMQLEPIIANNYEAGFASVIHKLSISASVYASTSRIGSTIIEENGYYVQQRAPERIIGVEGSVEYAPLKKLSFATGFSYMEGKADINKNGQYDDDADVYLSGRRITPLKITATIKYQPTDKSYIHLDGLYSGTRDRFEPQANGAYKFGEGPVSSYGILNLGAGYEVNSRLKFFGGVENLLNKDYYPTTSQWYGLATSYVKANGTRYQLGINYNW